MTPSRESSLALKKYKGLESRGWIAGEMTWDVINRSPHVFSNPRKKDSVCFVWVRRPIDQSRKYANSEMARAGDCQLTSIEPDDERPFLRFMNCFNEVVEVSSPCLRIDSNVSRKHGKIHWRLTRQRNDPVRLLLRLPSCLPHLPPTWKFFCLFRMPCWSNGCPYHQNHNRPSPSPHSVIGHHLGRVSCVCVLIWCKLKHRKFKARESAVCAVNYPRLKKTVAGFCCKSTACYRLSPRHPLKIQTHGILQNVLDLQVD